MTIFLKFPSLFFKLDLNFGQKKRRFSIMIILFKRETRIVLN